MTLSGKVEASSKTSFPLADIAGWHPAASSWLCVLAMAFIVALFPILVQHYQVKKLPKDLKALGFPRTDTIFYYSAVREIFENGNGLFYANPASSNPNSPRIYTHLFFIICAWVWKLTGISFPTLDGAMCLVCGTGMFFLGIWALWPLCPQRRRIFWSLTGLVLLGGGIVWFWSILKVIVSPFSNDSLPIYFFRTWREKACLLSWGHNVFRNLDYSTECFYHILFFVAMGFAIRRRYVQSLVVLFLCWWTHPFTALEATFILGIFFFLTWILERQRKEGLAFAITIGLLIMGLGYNFIFLRIFPEHRLVLRQMLGVHYTFRLSLMPFAYGFLLPAALLGIFWRPGLERFCSTRQGLFTLCWLIISFVLLKNDLLLGKRNAVQPLHFSRGYVFLALLPPTLWFIESILLPLARKGFYLIPTLILGFLVLFTWPDNFLHTFPEWDNPAYVPYPSIKVEHYDLLQRLDELESTHTFCSDYHPNRLGYIIPYLTHHRSLVGHHYNTPGIDEKIKAAKKAILTGDVRGIMHYHVDTLILTKEQWEHLGRHIIGARWDILLEFDKYLVIALKPTKG